MNIDMRLSPTFARIFIFIVSISAISFLHLSCMYLSSNWFMLILNAPVEFRNLVPLLKRLYNTDNTRLSNINPGPARSS